MNFLFDVMKQQYGLFPSTSNFYEIANELFLRYPSLKPRHCNGFELLVHLLKAKFKQVRRPLLNDEQVAKFKIKYSRINSSCKRNSVLLNESVNLCSAKHHCHHSSDKNVV
ncbi:sterile alpha motif domain-containing protein 3-like [Hydra vulgaris]|uniref:sterile alpha motif domain-containing protein 3-like n=1 Tax=Hydra vulgaris TaxID=6087 RepID=UPI0032E9E82B